MKKISKETIMTEFNNSTDLIVKELDNYTILYLESLCSSNRINEFILKVLLINKEPNDLRDNLAGPNTKVIKKFADIKTYLTNGFTIILSENKAYAVETKGDLVRAISLPQVQPSKFGPKDAFNENILNNLGLIKRRIKDNNLINKDMYIGKRTSTKVSVVYLGDIAKDEYVKKIEEKLSKIDVDGILDSNILSQLLSEDNADFPTIFATERPDNVCSQLLEGKIAILVDTSPFALILPSFFADFINPTIDDYSKSSSNTFLKILRMFCFITTIIAPALYVALINYNHETIPLKLLISFAIQRDGVPFPAAIESMFMLFLCEVLRESDVRFPSAYGSSISILGALILGEAAISAGIVSPIMTIVIAITFITSLVFTENEIVNVLRYYRFIFLIGTILFGLFGIVFAGLFFLIHLASIEVLGIPYTYSLAPFDNVYFSKTLWRRKKGNDIYRSKVLTDNTVKGKKI